LSVEWEELVGPSAGLGCFGEEKGFIPFATDIPARGLVTVKVAGRGGDDPQCQRFYNEVCS
jgi:hypothetical protein